MAIFSVNLTSLSWALLSHLEVGIGLFVSAILRRQAIFLFIFCLAAAAWVCRLLGAGALLLV